MIGKSPQTDFAESKIPRIDPSAYVFEQSAVIGDVFLGKRVLVAPFASVRGDEGQRIYIDDKSNIQDGVIIHALESKKHGKTIAKNLVTDPYHKQCAVYVGKRVSLAHQAEVHGPAYIGDNTFIGMQSMVFTSRIGKNCVIEPKSLVLDVTIPDQRYVPAGTILKDQKLADQLPKINADYIFKDLNQAVVHVNTSLADGYNLLQSHQ